MAENTLRKRLDTCAQTTCGEITSLWNMKSSSKLGNISCLRVLGVWDFPVPKRGIGWHVGWGISILRRTFWEGEQRRMLREGRSSKEACWVVGWGGGGKWNWETREIWREEILIWKKCEGERGGEPEPWEGELTYCGVRNWAGVRIGRNGREWGRGISLLWKGEGKPGRLITGC